jgi:hypothetical protein
LPKEEKKTPTQTFGKSNTSVKGLHAGYEKSNKAKITNNK